MSKPSTFQVTTGVYCVMRRSYFTCSYLVEHAGGLVAIDAGMKSTGSEMLSAIAEIGRKPGDVRAILLTHWHNDHAAGASVLARMSGAEVYYSSAESQHLSREVASTGIRGRLSAVVPETGPLVLLKGLLGNAPEQPVEATRFVRDGDVVEGFEVLETPGHTRGHLSYYYRPLRVLFAGDALAVIDGRLRFMSRPVTEDLDAARASMGRCLSLPIDFICPGHREPLTRDAQAECERMRAHLDRNGHWPLFG
jgi:glyoxylase-like metal-dependent hydrolase (beta-lactamase superfamily II)